MNDTITEEKIDKYLSITKEALDKLKVVTPDRSFARDLSDSFLEMAQCYYNDALTFRANGDFGQPPSPGCASASVRLGCGATRKKTPTAATPTPSPTMATSMPMLPYGHATAGWTT